MGYSSNPEPVTCRKITGKHTNFIHLAINNCQEFILKYVNTLLKGKFLNILTSRDVF